MCVSLWLGSCLVNFYNFLTFWTTAEENNKNNNLCRYDASLFIGGEEEVF